MANSDSTRSGWHLTEYAIEAWAIATFMLSACVFGTLIFHTGSPLHAALGKPLWQRAVMGVIMGATAVALIYSPWGRRSGAHMNPSLTLTFLRLGKVAPRDAIGYIIAQFVGAVVGVALSARLIGDWLAHPAVHYVVTMPGHGGRLLAFLAELGISALLMTVVLRSGASTRWARFTGVFAALLVASFITVESPMSGMSMNPARSFGSAAVAQDWASLWIYFTAPLAGMLLAAEWHLRRRGEDRVPCAKLMHATPCLFCDYARAPKRAGTHASPAPHALPTR